MCWSKFIKQSKKVLTDIKKKLGLKKINLPLPQLRYRRPTECKFKKKIFHGCGLAINELLFFFGNGKYVDTKDVESLL